MPEASVGKMALYTAIFTVAALSMFEMTLTLAFTTKMSDVIDLLEPCNEECVHMKLFSDSIFNSTMYNWSYMSNLGLQFHMLSHGQTYDKYSQCHKLVFVTNGKDLETMDRCPDDSFVRSMPNPVCSNKSVEEMQDFCETRKSRQGVINEVFGSKSMYMFLGSTVLWGLSRMGHDILVLCTEGIKDRIIFPVLCFNSCVSSLMAGSALLWSTGALGLFVAPVNQDCSCYYKLKDVPALLFLAIPVSLVIHATNKVRDMIQAFKGGPYLMSITYHIPHRLVVTATAKVTGPLLSVKGAGVGSRPAKRDRLTVMSEFMIVFIACHGLLGVAFAVELASANFTSRIMQFTSLDFHQGIVASIALSGGMVIGLCFYFIYVFSTGIKGAVTDFVFQVMQAMDQGSYTAVDDDEE